LYCFQLVPCAVSTRPLCCCQLVPYASKIPSPLLPPPDFPLQRATTSDPVSSSCEQRYGWAAHSSVRHERVRATWRGMPFESVPAYRSGSCTATCHPHLHLYLVQSATVSDPCMNSNLSRPPLSLPAPIFSTGAPAS